MSSTAVLGKVFHKINGIEVVEATNISINKNLPLTVKKTTARKILIGQGIGDTRIRLTFAHPADKAQFELFGKTVSGDTGFVYEFSVGLSQYLVPGCFIGNADLTFDPAQGNLDVHCEIQGGEIEPRA